MLVVTEDDYNNCRATHPIFFSNNDDTEVELDRPGLFYFIRASRATASAASG